MMRAAVPLAIVLAVPAWSGCRPPAHAGEPTVCVAASLTDVVAALVALHAERHDPSFDVHAGASGALCHQIELGAPCDVFVSADPAWIDRLERRGLIDAASTRTLATNRLVIAVTKAGTPIDGPAALTSDALRRIAVADPQAAPAGRYAKEALQRASVWRKVRAKAVFTGDVRAAARLLELRAVDAAVVYATDVAAIEGIQAAFTFGRSSHAPIRYVGAAISTSNRHTDAVAFLDFAEEPQVAAIWARHGFLVETDPGGEVMP